MKKLLAALVLVVVVMAGNALGQSAQANQVYTINVGDVTVDSQYTATAWNILDSAIVASTDTATITFKVSGVAVMDPRDRLFLGFYGHVGSTLLPNIDTLIVSPPTGNTARAIRVPFEFSYAVCDTVNDPLLFFTDAAITDTVGLMAACGGGGVGIVTLEDVYWEVFLHKCNDCLGEDYAR